jgi:hypothetical protein
MECVKLGIVGICTMGSVHAQSIMAGKIARCNLPPSVTRSPNA